MRVHWALTLRLDAALARHVLPGHLLDAKSTA
jgi:hypothetical protein